MLGGRQVETTLTAIEQRMELLGQRVRLRSRSTTEHDLRPVRQRVRFIESGGSL